MNACTVTQAPVMPGGWGGGLLGGGGGARGRTLV